MNKLRTFWRTYVCSLTDPTYYRDIREASGKFTAKYLLMFLLLLAIANAVRFGLQTIPHYKEIARDITHEVTTNYPSDLVITIKNGVLDINGVEEPFNVPPPTHFKRFFTNLEYQSLVTFDTQAESPDDSSLIFVTNDTIFYQNPGGTTQSQPVSEVIDQDVTIERNGLQLLVSNVQSIIDNILRLAPIAVFLFGITIYPLLALLINLIYSVILYVLAMLRGIDLSFLKSYQLSLHILTFAETARFLKNVLFANQNVPSIYSLAFLGAIIIIVSSLRSAR